MDRIKSILAAAGIALAISLAISCSSDDGGNNDSSTGYTDKDKCAQQNKDQTLGYILNTCEINGESLAELFNAFNAMGNSGLGNCSHEELLGALDKTPAEIVVYCNTDRNCGNTVTSEGTVACGGKTYRTVKIGSQTWMAENLNYNIGGSLCYNNDPVNCTTYGRLYYWETAKTICPSGWHLPSDEEWATLTNYVESQGGCSSCAGTRLKANSSLWSTNTGTDDHGFSAMPGGNSSCSDFGCSFYEVGYYGYWWSSTEDNASGAWFRHIYDNGSDVGRNYYDYYDNDKNYLYSVRCVKDSN